MVNTMENAEEVMQILDRFTRLKQKEIPKELDDYLQYVAKTGDTVFKWSSLKYLFREKLLNVIKHFHDTTPRVDEIPQYPNVDPFNYESMKSSLLERLEHFNAAPFTIQRLCELLIDPRKQYSRIDKFMRALEKNILVSTVEPGRKRTDSENGDSLDSVVNGDLSLDVNVDIEMDNEALFAIEGQNGNGAIPVPVPVAVAAVVEALNDCKEKSGVAILNAENSNASRSGDDDILPHPKKAKLELHDNEKKLEEAVEEEEKGVQKEKQELKNGNDEVKPALEVATCAEKTEKVEEKEKKVEENGNMEIEKTNEALEKQEDAKTVVKKDEKVVEEQKMLVEETAKETAKPTSVSTVEVKEVKEIIEKHKNESELKNQKEVEKAEIQTNDVNEKPLIEQKKEIVEKKVVVEEDVKEPQEVLKHTEEQLKVATVEKEEIKVDAIEPTIAAAAAVTDTKTDTVTDKIVENIENIPEKVETATATAQEETIHKKDANENKDTTKTEKVVEVEPTVVAKISSETKVEPAVVEKPTVEQVTEKVAAETKAVVEEKVVEKVENLETAAKADETEKKQELTASTEKTQTTVEDVQKTTDTVVGVVATDATVAEEQKTEQIVSDDIKVEKSENVSPAAVPVPVVAKPAVVAEKPKIVTEVEVEENMQMPIETDSPTAAAGIDIDEIPSAMVSSELPAVVPTIPILNEASPAVSILAPALSLNDQPMEDLPMEESAPEEVVMAETVAAGNGALVDQMTTDAMEASGKDELPVDGMDVDDTSQEAMDQ